MIFVSVTENKAWCNSRDTLTSGSVGTTITVSLDSAWDELSAFAVFKAHDRSEAVPVTGDTVEIPAHVLAVPDVHLVVGFYGIDTVGKVVIPTVYADLGEIRAGANLTGSDNYVPPPATLYAQILALTKAAQSAAVTAASGTYAGSVTFSIDSDGELILTVTEDGESTPTSLGAVTAYAAAKAGGYTGTYAEFQALLTANARTEYEVAQALSAVSAVVETANSAQAAASAAQTAASSAQTAASAAQAAVAGKQAKHKTAQVFLASGATTWTNLSVEGVTAENTVLVTPAPESFAAWVTAGVYCSGQGDGVLSFASAATTSSALTANVLILD